MKNIISQELLEHYCEPQQLRKLLSWKWQKMRSKILYLANSQAPVEDGELTLDVKLIRSRRLTKENVQRAFGPKVLAKLLRGIKPTVNEHLCIRQRQKPRRRAVRDEPVEGVDASAFN